MGRSATAKIKVLPGGRHRERVVTPEEEARYLAAAPKTLASMATILVDTGMRPEEAFRLRWENVTWLNGRNGVLLVTHGKKDRSSAPSASDDAMQHFGSLCSPLRKRGLGRHVSTGWAQIWAQRGKRDFGESEPQAAN